MANPVDPGDKLHRVLNALAEDLANVSDIELVAEARAAGRDPARSAGELRDLLLGTVKDFKDKRRRAVERAHQASVERLNAARFALPETPAEQRALLAVALERRPDVREMTVQHRDFTELSDDDVASLLKQLQHLGVLDDTGGTEKK